ncbi:MAG: efflux RND transporter periplasmic adaptor subunit, partial [Muribaculaceae bacterium]|nr:efflux RND transporter periplasmic adaptor subunit [Muribaculaceae bacterium]
KNAMPPVQLQLANGEIYPEPGKIVSISGVLDSSTGSAQVKAQFPNPEGMLRSGNTGNVLIPSSSAGAIQIPQSATYEIQDMKFVYVVGDSAKVHSTPITVSELNDGKNYIVTSGLQKGQQIVVEGIGISVADGMTIKPKTAGAPAGAASQNGDKK